MKKSVLLQAALTAILFSGCHTAKQAGTHITFADSVPIEDAAAPAPAAMKMKSRRSQADRAVSNAAFSAGNFNAPAGRKMAFSANITINVTDVKKAIADTRKQTAAAGGYVKTLNNNMLVLAIPVAQGDKFLNILAGMGEVSNLRIEGDDVTEQAADLKIRMENLEKSRKRLLAMMDRTANVRDLTQVERELNRVTTELERLQAADKNLSNRIAYVTISVVFRAHAPSPVTPRANVPLRWINQLGEGLQKWVSAGQQDVEVPFRVELPAKFFFAGGEYAVSGNNCNIWFRSIRNAVTDIRWYGKKYAGTEFYQDMIAKALQIRFGKKVSGSQCRIDGKNAIWFQVETNIYGVDYLYLVAVAIDDDTVKVIEAKGKKQDLLKDMGMDGWKKMLESIRL